MNSIDTTGLESALNTSEFERLTAEDRVASLEQTAKRRLEDMAHLSELLAAMTAARDDACRMLEGCINELAEHEEDPSMMWGHRELLAKYRKVGQ